MQGSATPGLCERCVEDLWGRASSEDERSAGRARERRNGAHSAKPAIRRSKLRTWYLSLERTWRRRAVLPTLEAPKRTVNVGTVPSARSMAWISRGRSKKPGSGEKVCDGGTVTGRREDQRKREGVRAGTGRRTRTGRRTLRPLLRLFELLSGLLEQLLGLCQAPEHLAGLREGERRDVS